MLECVCLCVRVRVNVFLFEYAYVYACVRLQIFIDKQGQSDLGERTGIRVYLFAYSYFMLLSHFSELGFNCKLHLFSVYFCPRCRLLMMPLTNKLLKCHINVQVLKARLH